MKFLLLNQAFYPDVASSAQHLSDLASGLVERGHQVTVVASRRSYDNPRLVYPEHETWRTIKILRLSCTGCGKRSRWSRWIDFGTFWICCAARLARLRRHDVVVALTSPPLISVLGASYAAVMRSRFCYWVMDLNPDEAIAAGWLERRSLVGRCLEGLSRLSLRAADKVIALDEFMARRIVGKGVEPGRVVTVPPWSHDDDIRFDPHGRELFRSQHGLEGKFVVMYAGNHSPCHPLNTLLEASRRLATDPSVIFCFVGGGSEWRRIGQDSLPPNVRMLPYQPREALSGVLSAADLHVVVMGAPFVGLVHPCKIYNLLRIGAPLLYIGPRSGPIAALLHEAERELAACVARPGNSQEVMDHIQHMRRIGGDARAFRISSLAARYSRANLLPRLIDELEAGLPQRRAAFKALVDAAGDARRRSPAPHFTRSVR